MNNIKCDLHIHSIASGHAFNTIDECSSYAFLNQYSVIGLSDHGPSMEGAPHLGYFEMLYRLPKDNNGIRMLYGCEANILDEEGTLDISNDILKTLDYTMAGLHKRTPYMGTSKEKNTKAIINAIKQGMVDIITHPVSWNFPIDIYSIIDVASEYNVLLEANKTILLEALYRKKENTIVDYKKILMEAESAGVHIIWGSDAHHVSEMLLSDQEFQYLSSVYEFDFSKVINNKPDDLLTLLYNRRQGK